MRVIYGAVVAAMLLACNPAHASTVIHSRSGARATVNSAYASRFICLIHKLEAVGYRIQFMGGYRHTKIAGTNHWSKHASGAAIDINQTARNRVTRRFPHGVSSMAASCGLFHGALWRNPDTGHFEVR